MYLVVRKTQSNKVHPNDIVGGTLSRELVDKVAAAKTSAESFIGRTYVVLPVDELL